jgi:chromosome segregation protein
MIIKKLELQGFKSFSDRTRVVFHPGITAIIGPNGTGKSNLVDGLLWTLRGRRLRAQRGERSGENIFNGNANKAPMSMADVAVVLGEETKSDKEDLVINHRMFRSGENEYRLNGKITRLMDIQEALHQNAIGDTDYFVIEQGSVGLFVTSKPLEKRLLLEEAAGTAYYKDKKRQAQSKLDNSEYNLLRLEDIILEVEKSTGSLKRQAQAAIRYRKLREHIRELTLAVYRKKIEIMESGQRDASAGYREKLSAEAGITERIKAEEKNLASQRQHVWDEEKRLQEQRESLYALKARFSRLEAEKERDEKRIDFFIDKKSSAKTDERELRQENESLEKEHRQVTEDLLALRAKLEERKKALAEAEKTQAFSQQDMESRVQRIEQFRDAYLAKLSSQTEVKNDAARYEKELELTSRQADKLTRELAEQSSSRQDKAAQLKRQQAELDRIRKDLMDKNTRLEFIHAERQQTRESVAHLQDDRTRLQGDLDKQSHHLHALKKIKEQEARSASIPDLPEALGQLADFIEGSEEHTVLLDVFYKEEAKAALIRAGDLMQALEKKSLKGQILLLHPQEQQPLPSSLTDDPRVLGMLKGNIRTDVKIRHQLSALSDAAIVRTVRDAVELWIKHPQISYVTLNGDLLLASGLLKIGEKKDGLIALNREIRSLTQQTARLQDDLNPVLADIQKNTQQLEELEHRIQNETGVLSGLNQKQGIQNKEVTFAQNALQETEAHIQLLKNESIKIEKDRLDITRNWKTLTVQINDLKEQETSLNDTLREEEKALSAVREKTELARRAFFQLRSDVELVQEKIDNAEALLKRLDARNTFVDHKSTELSKEILLAEQEQEKLKAHIFELNGQAGRLDQEVKEGQSQVAEKESELGKKQTGLQELEARIQNLREEYEGAKEVRVKWEVSKAERERDLVNLEESCWQELKKTLQEIKAEVSPEHVDIAEAETSLDEAREKLQRLSAVNLMAEEEYLAQKERYDFLSKQRADLAESIASTKEAIKKIDHESKNQFMRALIAVNKYFQEVFAQLFQGGAAQVKLVDEDDPLESGIEIVAQPPGKRVQSLNLLSGGEKTLTSLAFFFALFRYKPAPFCILDEVDAALDETNLSRFLNLMRAIKDQTQFIIITHNFKTMEVADYIYGTTMAEPNITSIYSVKIKEKGEEAASAEESENNPDT